VRAGCARWLQIALAALQLSSPGSTSPARTSSGLPEITPSVPGGKSAGPFTTNPIWCGSMFAIVCSP
jgi:hypothetical protein